MHNGVSLRAAYYERTGPAREVLTIGELPTPVAVAWRRDACTPLVSEFVAIARRLALVPGCVPDSSLSRPVEALPLTLAELTGIPSGQIQPVRGTGERQRRRT